jgi:hypothetical protein
VSYWDEIMKRKKNLSLRWRRRIKREKSAVSGNDAGTLCSKAEECVQYMKLIEMLHEGKISREMYQQMKPKGIYLYYSYFV